MAISAPTTFINSMASIGDVSTYTTMTAGAPDANALALVFVCNRQGTANVATPTLEGGGITAWSLHTTVEFGTIAAPQARVTMFRALEASPGADSILTVDFGGAAQQKCLLIGVQWPGVETSGTNGDTAIAQVAINRSNSDSALTTTLGSAIGSGGATGGCAYANVNTTAAAGDGYAIVGQGGPDSSRGAHVYRLDGNTVVDIAFATTVAPGGIAYEVAEAAGGSVVGQSTSQRATRRRRR